MIINDWYAQLFQMIQPKTTIVTPNRRLSATLHKYYAVYQSTLKNNYWLTPDILPLTTWLTRLLHEQRKTSFQTVPFLLSTTQEQYLWEKIIAQSDYSAHLLQIKETADVARNAWTLMQQWQVDLQDARFENALDYQAFQQWASTLQMQIKQNHWTDNACLADYLTQPFITQLIPVPHAIILVGFTELSPQLQKLLNVCKQGGCQIHSFIYQKSARVQRVQLTDTKTELLTMARFAKSIWLKDQACQIGCVTSSISSQRDRIVEIFSEVFAEKNTYIVDQTHMPFNVSGGKNLNQYPLIQTALALLNLSKKIISREMFNYLLSSPFWGEAESERIARFKFDAWLRHENIKTIDLTLFLQQHLFVRHYCHSLNTRLNHFFSFIDTLEPLQNHFEFATHFQSMLNLLGWPGERSLNSEEYQLVESWLELLNDFTSLDHVWSEPVSFAEGLNSLTRIINQTLFQPKSPEAPIQVLGILEAAGLYFDYLWVAGVDDMTWPPVPKPNPFIPKEIQRQLAMPHATADREFKFCDQLIHQFKQLSGTVFFSHAEKHEDLVLHASPLIKDLPLIPVDELELPHYVSAQEHIYHSKNIEVLVDETAPVVNSGEKIRGGVNIIKHQALCPFKAYAENRLHARELENTHPGLRAKDRGSWIHKILEKLWERLNDHPTLLAMQKTELDTCIANCIDSTATDITALKYLPASYLSLEKQRMQRLITMWLQHEKERPPFKVISHEQKAEIQYHQLTFSVRIDRIDELMDGKKLIIDYKTGKYNDIQHFFTERPEEPQLPLYLLLATDHTIGIAFAQIATGNYCFKGVSHYATDINGIKMITEIKKANGLSWQAQLTAWQTTFHQLSHDFCQGIATVDPKDPVQTCIYCALKPLCRVNDHDYLRYSRTSKST